VWAWIMLKGFSVNEQSIVHDGLPFAQDIGLLRARYNTQGHELFIVYPCKDSNDSWLHCHHHQPVHYTWKGWNVRPSDEQEISETLRDKAAVLDEDPHHVVLYLHGGGFVAANASVLLQQAATMVRRGSVAVYALDYPLAPGQAFPVAIYSVMDSLVWLKKHRNIDKVTVVGDSAGGSLAAYVTALVTSPTLLALFQKETAGCMTTTSSSSYVDLPELVGLASVYGVLDSTSFLQQPPLETISWFEWIMAVNGLKFCLECYHNPLLKNVPQQFCDLLEDHRYSSLISSSTIDDERVFPPTLLVCGTQDPLIHSTQKAARLLRQNTKNVVTVHLFEARHGFVGFPRAWQGPKLRCQAAKADAVIGDFLWRSKPQSNTHLEQ
jgi:acetyl esterase/lipase